MADVYVALAFKGVFEFGDKPVIKFDGGDVGSIFCEFSGEYSVAWADFNDVIVWRKFCGGYYFLKSVFIYEEVLTKRFFCGELHRSSIPCYNYFL